MITLFPASTGSQYSARVHRVRLRCCNREDVRRARVSMLRSDTCTTGRPCGAKQEEENDAKIAGQFMIKARAKQPAYPQITPDYTDKTRRVTHPNRN